MTSSTGFHRLISDNAAGQARLLAEVTRGTVSESRHWGHIVVMDGDSRLVGSLGSPELLIHLRSSAKPFQAIPLIDTGAAARFGFDAAEVAIACGSHGGEPVHVRTVEGMLAKLGLTAADLACGEQVPYNSEARRAVLAGGGATPLHNNCSGKHSGMLAVALQLGVPITGYERRDHPVQLRILASLGTLLDRDPEEIVTAIDGCGVPSFALPLRELALLNARLALPEGAPREAREPLREIRAAMMGHPVMVSGSEPGRDLDTHLMRAVPGAIVSKQGAEGVYGGAVLPSERWPRGLGIAIKFEDGDLGARARGPVVIELLKQLGVLGEELPESLLPFDHPQVTNRRGTVVGEIRPRFVLRYSH